MGRANHANIAHALWVILSKGERGHAAIRRANNGGRLVDCKMIEQSQKPCGLVLGGDAIRAVITLDGRRKIHAQNLKL